MCLLHFDFANSPHAIQQKIGQVCTNASVSHRVFTFLADSLHGKVSSRRLTTFARKLTAECKPSSETLGMDATIDGWLEIMEKSPVFKMQFSVDKWCKKHTQKSTKQVLHTFLALWNQRMAHPHADVNQLVNLYTHEAQDASCPRKVSKCQQGQKLFKSQTTPLILVVDVGAPVGIFSDEKISSLIQVGEEVGLSTIEYKRSNTRITLLTRISELV